MHIPTPPTYLVLDCRTVAKIEEKITEQSKRNGVSRFFHSRNDKDTIATWKSDLNRVLNVFNVCLASSCLVIANVPCTG